jgi:hypothetical protein
MTSPNQPLEPPRRGGWILGAILMALGGVFLLQNAGVPLLQHNWWALFILIPAFGSFSMAWTVCEQERQVTPAVTGLAVGGMVPLVVALVFLLGLDFGQWWPLLPIAAGIAALLGGYRRRGRLTETGYAPGAARGQLATWSRACLPEGGNHYGTCTAARRSVACEPRA